MPSRTPVLSTSVALAAIVAVTLAASQAASPAPAQRRVNSHGGALLKAGSLSFRDLNRNGALDPYEDWRLPAGARVADLLSRMTLEEKAGLMQIASFNANSLNDYVNQRHIRYLILRDNPGARELAQRANASQEIAERSRLGIPIVFASNPRNHIRDELVYEEAEAAGVFSSWPGTLGLAATNDLTLIRAFAEIARAEWRAAGIEKCYGYQVDVATEPRWYRIQTTFGESPKLNADVARELVLGFQGKTLGPESVAQTIKHFPGDGAVDKGLDPHSDWGQWAVYPTPGSLFTYQLPPFQAAVDAGTSSIMSYYNNPSNEKSAPQWPKEWWVSGQQQFEGVAGAYNSAILTRLLRGRMGFKGYVNTDSGVLTNTTFGVEQLSVPQRFAKAVKAGVSLFSDNNDPQGLVDAVHQGLLTEEDLNRSAALLLAEIFQLGLFDDPYTDPDNAQRVANAPASAARADEAHRKSIVLLRNDRKLLPIGGARKIYAEVMAGQSGNGRGGRGERAAANPTNATAALKALLGKDPTVQIVDSLDEADVALLWLRPTVYQRPEHDYADIALGPLTGIDVGKVRQIEAAKPTVLVINFINPWIVNEVEPGAAAVLATFDVKAEALLDVITGRAAPVGKLPLTIPADRAAVDRNAPDVPGYAETFEYAYTNRVKDRYVFGFGLSYGR